MDLNLVIRRDRPIGSYYKFEYLNAWVVWSVIEVDAYLYSSSAVFADAKDNDGSVYIRLPSGREIAVDESDFLK